eukprot:2829862-Rhodomonas_salina.3
MVALHSLSLPVGALNVQLWACLSPTARHSSRTMMPERPSFDRDATRTGQLGSPMRKRKTRRQSDLDRCGTHRTGRDECPGIRSWGGSGLGCNLPAPDDEATDFLSVWLGSAEGETRQRGAACVCV